jgi:hypothetical protein
VSIIKRARLHSETRTGHEGPEGKYRYSYILSLTLTLHASGWSTPRPGRFTPCNDPLPIVQEAGWVSGPVWTGAENLAPTGIRSPDRLARTECLYWLSYLGPLLLRHTIFIWHAFIIRCYATEWEGTDITSTGDCCVTIWIHANYGQSKRESRMISINQSTTA